MDTLASRLAALKPVPEDQLALWVSPNNLIGRVDQRGKQQKTGGEITAALVLKAAERHLAPSSDLRVQIQRISRGLLRRSTPKAGKYWPWPRIQKFDEFAAAYTTSRIISDVGADIAKIALSSSVNRTILGLKAWLRSRRNWNASLQFPSVYRTAIALEKLGKLTPDARRSVGDQAQALVKHFISSHALGTRSQFDPTLLCLALVADCDLSTNPLTQAEREKCIRTAMGDQEALITVSRLTLTRLGDSAVGCSAIEVLHRILHCAPIAHLLITQEKQIVATLDWLEDHSTFIAIPNKKRVRVFQSDIYPDYLTYDAWFNALVLLFLTDLQEFLSRMGQEQLRRDFKASQPAPRYSFAGASTGGYQWPTLLQKRFVDRVVKDGRVTDESGNGIVLFGPPGTGKSTLAKLIAKEVRDWHYIELSTADFLVDGPANIFRTIRRVFDDLRKAQNCVVFFDELELLVLERDGDKSDWTTGAVTNVMLPELQKLHDCEFIIPIFATNHISKFDSAGRRPGRFDYILPVGLPSAIERRVLLRKFLPKQTIFKHIENICDGASLRQMYDWARAYRDSGSVGQRAAISIWKDGFEQLVADQSTLSKFKSDIDLFAYPPGVV